MEEEPSSKRSKMQKVYNDRRGPRKPRFTLDFQFNFGEHEEMKEVQERFVRLRNHSTARSGRANADFLIALLDSFEELSAHVLPTPSQSLSHSRPFLLPAAR